jgi:hypothetical protein
MTFSAGGAPRPRSTTSTKTASGSIPLRSPSFSPPTSEPAGGAAHRRLAVALSPGTGGVRLDAGPRTAGPVRRTQSPSRRKGQLRGREIPLHESTRRSAQNDRTAARLSGLGFIVTTRKIAEAGERCRYGLWNSHSVDLRRLPNWPFCGVGRVAPRDSKVRGLANKPGDTDRPAPAV